MRALLLACLSLASCATARSGHSLAWWQAQREQQFPAPAASELPALIDELVAQLSNPDPDWREHVAIDGLNAWTYRAPLLDAAGRSALVEKLCANLRHGIEEPGDDRVLGRSFAALALSTLAAADNQQSCLSEAQHDALCRAALDYLRDERDPRGYDERVGWRHSVAHTADLLKFLARSPKLTADEQRALLDGLRAKLVAPETGALVWGEPERIAKALLSIVRRADFDREYFAAWTNALPEAAKEVWAREPLDAAAFRALQNQRDVFAALASLLAAVEGENAKFALESAVRGLWS
jgi:Protein of unknown function (DUF2785)